MPSEASLLDTTSRCRMLHLGCKHLFFRPGTCTALRGTRPHIDSAGSNAMAPTVSLPSATIRSTPLPLSALLLQSNGIETMIMAKRKVAVFVAYVGSTFRGLQIQRDQPGGTVEDVLQKAIYATGAILPSNYGDLHKIGWTRSSRTDKGVHALANVVAMKLECHPSSFAADPEGSQLSNSINQHLPAEVRVLSVQRVNNGFNARGFCNNRTYHYYLPTTILGLALDGGAEDEARMRLLRQCCSLYQGNHPFHNYTKRRLYRTPESPSTAGTKHDEQSSKHHAKQQEEPAATSDQLEQQGTTDSTRMDAEAQQGVDLLDWENVQLPGESTDALGAAQSSTSTETSPAAAVAKSSLWMKPRPLVYRWLDSMEPQDLLAPAHYRFIKAINVDDPMPLTPQGASAVRVGITGSSFMLHQIRHMVGAATAVARGNLPLEYVSASLCAPARAVLPLAPAEVLVLASSSFQPFPSHCKDGLGPIQTLSGAELQLRSQGKAARDDFAQKVLHPAIERLFDHEVWAHWDNDLKLTCWHDGDLQAFQDKADRWQKQRAVLSQEKQDRLRAKTQDAGA